MSNKNFDAIPEAVLTFCKNLKVEILSEINENNKIVKYKFEPETEEEESAEITMLLSYQVSGQDHSRVTIGLFEFDL